MPKLLFRDIEKYYTVQFILRSNIKNLNAHCSMEYNISYK